MEKIITTYHKEIMKKKRNVPIVTVTYQLDKWTMLLQAHSIEKFVTNPTTHYVVLSDRDLTPASILEWHCILQPIYKKHRLVLLHKYNAVDMFPEIRVHGQYMQGWDLQQFIKLKIHQLITDEYYLTLDSKNIFVLPTNLVKTFWGIEGTSTIIYQDTKDPDIYHHPSMRYWLPFMRLLEKRFLLTNNRPKSLWFAGTPFCLETATVQRMFDYDIEALFAECMQIIDDIGDDESRFIDKPMISEYVLYSYFTKKERIETQWAFGLQEGNDPISVYEDIVAKEEIPTFTLFRHESSDIDTKINLINFFLRAGLESSYVTPAVMLNRNLGE